MAEAKLLNEERIVAEKVCCLFRTSERGDWVGLGIIKVRLRNRSIIGWNARTVFPMTRTGVFNFLGEYGGTRSTERTGQLYVEYLERMLSDRISKKSSCYIPERPDGSNLIGDGSAKRTDVN